MTIRLKIVAWVVAVCAIAVGVPALGNMPGTFNPTLLSSTFTLRNSLVVDATAKYLQRTYGSPTASTTHTLSLWLKRLATGTTGNVILTSASPSTESCYVIGGSSFSGGTDKAGEVNSCSSAALSVACSTAITDTTTWHNIVYSVNTGTATVYLDGTSCGSGGAVSGLNSATAKNLFNYSAGNLFTVNSLVADVHFVDGQALTPTSFTTGTGAGTIHPKQYIGTNGNNGFWLSFCSSGTIGADDGAGAQCGAAGANTWAVNGSPSLSSDVPN